MHRSSRIRAPRDDHLRDKLTGAPYRFVEKTSDTTARIVYRFPVGHSYLNPSMTLHGGQQAAIFDIMTSWLFVLVRKPDFWNRFGTSRTLNVTFIRPAVEGEMLRLETEVRPVPLFEYQTLANAY